MVTVEIVITIVATAMASVVAITNVINLLFKKEEQKIHFRFYKNISVTDNPIPSNMAITVVHPDKVIEKCNLLFDNKPLPCNKINGVLQYEEYGYVMGGITFRIPKGKETNENALIVLRNGKKKIRKPITLKDLPLG